MQKEYALGLDLGSTSIGWSAVLLDEALEATDILDMGVRIFPDGRDDKSKQPLTVTRREARGMRRRLNRVRIRYTTVRTILQQEGWLPQEKSAYIENLFNTVYALRAKAVQEQCTLEELAVVILHIAKRRGFKSNRKDIAKDGGGKIKAANERLIQALNGKTLGEFLYTRLEENKERQRAGEKTKSIRLKNLFDSSGNVTSEDALYPTRAMYEEELERIWNFQQKYYPTKLTQEVKEKLFGENKKHAGIFFQRPLKPQELGKCYFEPTEYRVYKAMPIFQKFRILSLINKLTYKPTIYSSDHILNQQQRNDLFAYLYHYNKNMTKSKKVIPFAKIAQCLGLTKDATFNLAVKEEGLHYNRTAFIMSQEEYCGADWEQFTEEKQNALVTVLVDTHYSDEEAYNAVVKLLPEYTEEKIKKLLEAPLEEGTGNLSAKAIEKILPQLEEGFQYHKACAKVGYNHSDQGYEQLDSLPYYGVLLQQHCLHGDPSKEHVVPQYGRIMNATVHIALNELRIVVNELIARYGKPARIAIELARDIGASTKELTKINSEQGKNRKEKERIAKELIDSGIFASIEHISYEDYQRYILWEKLDKDSTQRKCLYTGKPIGIKELFSEEFEIEHILPYSRTFNDSMGNKTISYWKANRIKSNKTPYEAFRDMETELISWKDIQARIASIKDFKEREKMQRLFSETAMKGSVDEIIARQLNDTRYMSRMALQYVKSICKNPQAVYSVTGKLTSILRHYWELNTFKNKGDSERYRAHHIHHAIDAFVVACTTRSMVQHAQILAERKEQEESTKEQPDTNYRIEHKGKKQAYMRGELLPFESWKQREVKERFWNLVENTVISYKRTNKNVVEAVKRKQTTGQLMEDTAYGLVRFVSETKLEAEFIHKGEKSIKESIGLIPIFKNKEDKKHYYTLYKEYYINENKVSAMNAVTKEEKAKKEYQKKYEERLIADIQEASKKALKWHIGGSNYCAEVYEIHPSNKIQGVADKKAGKWEFETVSTYEAHRRALAGEYIGYWKLRYPNAKKIMTLRINDMVEGTFSFNYSICEIWDIVQAINFDENSKKEDLEKIIAEVLEGFQEEKIVEYSKIIKEVSALPKGIRGLVLEELEKKKIQLQKTGEIQEYICVSIIFRVKKLGQTSLTLRPHFISKEVSDKKCWMPTGGSLQQYNARKIEINALGKYK